MDWDKKTSIKIQSAIFLNRNLLFSIFTKAQNLVKICTPFLFYLSFFIVPRIAFAEGDTPVGEGLGYILNAMYGTTGIAIATLSIISVGLLCLGHVLEWKRLMQTVAGIGVIFGAGAIVKGIQVLVHNT